MSTVGKRGLPSPRAGASSLFWHRGFVTPGSDKSDMILLLFLSQGGRAVARIVRTRSSLVNNGDLYA